MGLCGESGSAGLDLKGGGVGRIGPTIVPSLFSGVSAACDISPYVHCAASLWSTIPLSTIVNFFNAQAGQIN